MVAEVIEIQIGGLTIVNNLFDACKELIHQKKSPLPVKINFTIKLPNGEIKTITVRDENSGTVAYGDFVGLPSFLEYAHE
jgi:hypothetical protein